LLVLDISFREAAVAPGYFKKAISEHGSEWSTHPKIIDMKVGAVVVDLRLKVNALVLFQTGTKVCQ
jgi:hypothetical protein